MIYDKTYYLDTFQVTEEMLMRLSAEGLGRGGDYSDLYFENTTYNTLLLRDSEVSSGAFVTDYGVGIRVLKGEKTGYAYAESTDYAAMLSAARAAASISQGPGLRADGELSPGQVAKLIRDAKDRAANYTPVSSNGDRPVRRFFTGTPNKAADRYPMLNEWRKTEIDSVIPYLKALEAAVRALDSRVIKVKATFSAQQSDILMFNSFGEMKYDTRPMGTVSMAAVFSKDGISETMNASRSYMKGSEMLTEEIIRELAAEVTEGIDERFEARRPKGGQMPVVMAAGASGILLHEAMGHAFEADFNRKGQSIFADKMGQRICPEGINIVDDGSLRGNRGAVNYDDEGVPGQLTYMVEDGVLNSFLHDRISAKFYGVTPTGNGRRESFRYAPLPRMRCTYMESGDCHAQDLIASVKKGIYVDKFSNGQVKIGEGDFTFFVKSGRMIENGRLGMPVKDINVIGNGPKALSEIRGVANDLKIEDGAWTCGKGQNVPVCCGIPTVLISNLTVGGE